jgi:uncharacterized SAM-binding protein YcdF (DUF218 family)
MKKLWFVLGVFFVLGLSLFLISMLFVLTNAYTDTTKKSDAIVVLGAGLTQEGYPCLEERVRHAADLYKQGIAPFVVFTGGKIPVDYEVEAKVMKQMGLIDGIPENSLILEGDSQNTYENFLFTKALLDKNNLHSIVIITDPLHEPRAALLAQKDGIPYTLSPAAKSSCSGEFPKNLQLLLHESVGIIYYKILGRI